MKINGILFIVLVFMVAFKYTKTYPVPWLWIIITCAVWFVFIYISKHLKNKEMNTPRPVYQVNPNEYE